MPNIVKFGGGAGGDLTVLSQAGFNTNRSDAGTTTSSLGTAPSGTKYVLFFAVVQIQNGPSNASAHSVQFKIDGTTKYSVGISKWGSKQEASNLIECSEGQTITAADVVTYGAYSSIARGGVVFFG